MHVRMCRCGERTCAHTCTRCGCGQACPRPTSFKIRLHFSSLVCNETRCLSQHVTQCPAPSKNIALKKCTSQTRRQLHEGLVHALVSVPYLVLGEKRVCSSLCRTVWGEGVGSVGGPSGVALLGAALEMQPTEKHGEDPHVWEGKIQRATRWRWREAIRTRTAWRPRG